MFSRIFRIRIYCELPNKRACSLSLLRYFFIIKFNKFVFPACLFCSPSIALVFPPSWITRFSNKTLHLFWSAPILIREFRVRIFHHIVQLKRQISYWSKMPSLLRNSKQIRNIIFGKTIQIRIWKVRENMLWAWPFLGTRCHRRWGHSYSRRTTSTSSLYKEKKR